MDVFVGVQFIDDLEELVLCNIGGERDDVAEDADFVGHFLFSIDVGDGGWVFADADEGEGGGRALNFGYLLLEVFDDASSDMVAIDDFHKRNTRNFFSGLNLNLALRVL